MTEDDEALARILQEEELARLEEDTRADWLLAKELQDAECLSEQIRAVQPYVRRGTQFPNSKYEKGTESL